VDYSILRSISILERRRLDRGMARGVRQHRTICSDRVSAIFFLQPLKVHVRVRKVEALIHVKKWHRGRWHERSHRSRQRRPGCAKERRRHWCGRAGLSRAGSFLAAIALRADVLPAMSLLHMLFAIRLSFGSISTRRVQTLVLWGRRRMFI